MHRTCLSTLVFLASLLLTLPGLAGQGGAMEARLADGKVALAEYHAGKRGQPAVLVLHGFLQTHHFPTVANVVETLATANFPVLAPTLSLGISRRNKSLPCEAIHLHGLEQDVEEIAFWVDWLARQGHKNIILVGHSFGSLQLLTYLARSPSPIVKQALLISLTDVELQQSASQRAQAASALRVRVARHDRTLAEVELGQCRKYVGPPDALLSYLSMSRAGILDELAHLPVKTGVILGSKDDRMGADWIDTLKARGIAVEVIPGASHFFDNQFEFDLQEAVLQAVRAG